MRAVLQAIPVSWRPGVRRQLRAYREGLLQNDFPAMSRAWRALKADAGPDVASELVRTLQQRLARKYA